jgi:hypothetical protein
LTTGLLRPAAAAAAAAATGLSPVWRAMPGISTVAGAPLLHRNKLLIPLHLGHEGGGGMEHTPRGGWAYP